MPLAEVHKHEEANHNIEGTKVRTCCSSGGYHSISRETCWPYAAYVFNSVYRILEQCNEHSKFSTLWGYKLFDPSLYPTASRTKIGEVLGVLPMCEQFDSASSNIEKFGRLLDTLVYTNREYTFMGERRAEYVVRALNELISEYTWDPLLGSDSSSSDEEKRVSLSRERLVGDMAKLESNTIILFSPLPTTYKEVAGFLNLPELEHSWNEQKVLDSLKFSFRHLQEALKRMNIQVCSVNIPATQELWNEERLETVLSSKSVPSLIAKALSHLVRCFMALESLVVSPALVPFRLVWNMMAADLRPEAGVKIDADVLCPGRENGPMHLMLCQVQLQAIDLVSKNSPARGSSFQTSKLISENKKVEILLRSIIPKSHFTTKSNSTSFLVRQSVCSAPAPGNDKDSLGDLILRLLQPDSSEFQPGNPIWQLLLLSLACEKSACLVTVDNKNGHVWEAILEPVTSHSAILTLKDKEILHHTNERSFCQRLKADEEDDGRKSSRSCTKEDQALIEASSTSKFDEDIPRSGKHEVIVVQSSRKRHRSSIEVGKCLQEWDDCYRGDQGHEERVSWKEFWGRKIALSKVNGLFLECDSVMSKYTEGGKASEVLQTMNYFLKEMKYQPCSDLALTGSQSENISAVSPECGNALTVTVRELSSRQASDSYEVRENGLALALIDEELPAPAREVSGSPSLTLEMTSDEAKAYIYSLQQKIQDYLSSTEADSQKFAEGLVCEAVKSHHMIRSNLPAGGQEPPPQDEDSNESLSRKSVDMLRKLLLKAPKSLDAKYADGVGSTFSAEEKQKEYELQILLRMEMISSDDGGLLQKPAKDKLVKEISKLLDNIQFYLGFFDGMSLLDYFNQLLNRYKESLPSTISDIMKEMDGLSDLIPPEVERADRTPVSESQPEKSSSKALDRSLSGSRFSAGAASKALQTTVGNISMSKVEKLLSNLGDLSYHKQDEGGKKKGYYHWAEEASNLIRVRKFKPHEKPKHKHSKSFRVPVKKNVRSMGCVLNHVPETPITHGKACRSQISSKASLLSHEIPQQEITSCSTPAHERPRREQASLAVEGTPYVRRSSISLNVSKSALSGKVSVCAPNHRSAAEINSPVFKINQRLFAGESYQPPGLAGECAAGPSSPISRRDRGCGQVLYPELLCPSNETSPKIEDRKLVPYFRRGLYDDDEDTDEDNDGGDCIISTPFKVNFTNHSIQSRYEHKNGLTVPDELGTLANGIPSTTGNIVRKRAGLLNFKSVPGTTINHALTRDILSGELSRNMSIDLSEDAPSSKHDIGTNLDQENLLVVYRKKLPRDSCCTDGMDFKAQLSVCSPLAPLCVNDLLSGTTKQHLLKEGSEDVTEVLSTQLCGCKYEELSTELRRCHWLWGRGRT